MPSGEKSKGLMQHGDRYNPNKNSRHSRSAWSTTGVLKPGEAARIELVVEFDRRMSQAQSSAEFYALAVWAEEHRLTLAKLARQRAEEAARLPL